MSGHDEDTIEPISSIRRYSIVESQQDRYDAELDLLLDPKNNAELARIIAASTTLSALIYNVHKYIEKVLSNDCEILRKKQLNNFLGHINTRPVLVLTAFVVLSQCASLVFQISPNAFRTVMEPIDKLRGRTITPMNTSHTVDLSAAGTSTNPSVTITPAEGIPSAILKDWEKRSENWAKAADMASKIFDALKQVAQSNEFGLQTYYRSEEEALKYTKQQSLDPSVTQAGHQRDEQLRNSQESANNDHHAKRAVLGAGG